MDIKRNESTEERDRERKSMNVQTRKENERKGKTRTIEQKNEEKQQK